MSKNLDFRKKVLYKSGGASGLFEMADSTALTPSLFTSAPTPGVTYRGLHYRTEGGAGVADTEVIIRKNTADAYVADPILTAANTQTLTNKTLTAPILNNFTGKYNVLASSGNTTMTSAMSGSAMLLDGATVAYALPAIGAGDIGMFFNFVWTVASTNSTITAGAGDILVGGLKVVDFDTANTATWFPCNDSSHLVATFNGTTKGGKLGTWVSYVAVSATRWLVFGEAIGDGTLATPFS